MKILIDFNMHFKVPRRASPEVVPSKAHSTNPVGIESSFKNLGTNLPSSMEYICLVDSAGNMLGGLEVWYGCLEVMGLACENRRWRFKQK